jgi:hypothetical protein
MNQQPAKNNCVCMPSRYGGANPAHDQEGWSATVRQSMGARYRDRFRVMKAIPELHVPSSCDNMTDVLRKQRNPRQKEN